MFCFLLVKDTKCELPDSYSPLYVESAWYSWWEKEVCKVVVECCKVLMLDPIRYLTELSLCCFQMIFLLEIFLSELSAFL